MFAQLYQANTVATQDADAPFEYLSGWLFGVSLQDVNIRDKMMACRVQNDDLTGLIYDAMAAVTKGDNDTAKDKFQAAKPKYATALAKCSKDITDPAN